MNEPGKHQTHTNKAVQMYVFLGSWRAAKQSFHIKTTTRMESEQSAFKPKVVTVETARANVIMDEALFNDGEQPESAHSFPHVSESTGTLSTRISPTRPYRLFSATVFTVSHLCPWKRGVIKVTRGFHLEKSMAGKYSLSEQMRLLWAVSVPIEQLKNPWKSDSVVKRTIYLHLTPKVCH